jgi:hypothetical protein
VVTASSVCDVFKCCSFLGGDFEIMTGHSIEQKEVNNKRESENYSEGRTESNCVTK